MRGRLPPTLGEAKDARAMSTDRILSAALAYAERFDFWVFPCHWLRPDGSCSCGKPDCKTPAKHPLTEHGLNDATTDPAQIRAWWKRFPKANVAINCGVSGLVVLDVDPRHGGHETLATIEAKHGKLPDAPTVLTGGGGLHIYLRPPADVEIRNSAGALGPGLDVRGEGGHVVAPPSVHATGALYCWEASARIDELEIPEAPAWLIGLLTAKPAAPAQRFRAPEIIAEGQRNDTLFRLARSLHARKLNYDEIVATLRAANTARCRPRLADAEVEQIVHNAVSKPDRPDFQARAGEEVKPQPESAKKVGNPSQADTLIKIAGDRAKLFHDGDTAYAILKVKSHHEVWRLQSKSFRDWLFKIYFEQEDRAPNAESVRAAINTLAGVARFGSRDRQAEEHKVFVRLAESAAKIYLDLADGDWRAVEIDADGWRLIDNPARRGVYFRRPRGVLSLPVPEAGGSIGDLRNFINVGDDRDFVLVVSWLIAAYRPRGPYPILVLNGEQGSAKTGASRFLRALVDPNISSARAAPKDVDDLMIAAVNGWIVAFDNLSHLSAWLSDGLCRLATGGGQSKRELYSDMDEVLLDAVRPTIINGIEELATRGDLLDRAIVNTLPTIPDDKRRAEDELNSEFEKMRPSLLGALLDGVSCALRNVGSVKLASYPRMADFAKWVVAAEPALPWASGEFLAAYQKNRDSANVVSLEASLIYGPLIAIGLRFEGTASELLDRLQAKLLDAKKPQGWPANAQSLAGALRRIAPSLRRDGTEVTFHDKSRPRKITIARAPRAGIFATDATTATAEGVRAHGPDATDANFPDDGDRF